MVGHWVSAEAIQQHLGISQDTLYRLIAGGASEPTEHETPGEKA